jgi:DNA-binding CsgD family transcriptional regulator
MYYSKIKSIKKIGIVKTYDINTPTYENFILDNGILSHNSGKSWSCLSIGEHWYKYKFNEQFPSENICFSLAEVGRKLIAMQKENRLRKGELIILEEAGANFSNLDYQSKLNKMFNFILQSFRSMNVILIMNLPVLTMMNKGARQLIHIHLITECIDKKKKSVEIKPLLHQLSQLAGKSYWKYPKMMVNGRTIKVKRIAYPAPSKELIELYEARKLIFVVDVAESFINEVDEKEQKDIKQEAKKEIIVAQQNNKPNEYPENDFRHWLIPNKPLTTIQMKVLDKVVRGVNTSAQIAKELNMTQANASTVLTNLRKKGYNISKSCQLVPMMAQFQ